MIHYLHMNINEFTAKKIGEVVAFCNIGSDTLVKGGDALHAQLGDTLALDIIEKNTLYKEALLHIVAGTAMLAITEAKATKTGEKLSAMRELYIGDQWGNPTEVFEWSGFFYGAAIVHFALVRGSAEALGHEQLIELANEAIAWNYEILESIESKLAEVGSDRAI